jgi:hypothetical protein
MSPKGTSFMQMLRTSQNRVKTKLRCEHGHVWKDVIFTSSVLSYEPPLCPKCLKMGIKTVGKPLPIVPFRTKVKNLAKALTITPLKYLVAKPVCFAAKYLVAVPTVFVAKYLVATPVVFGAKLGAFAFFKAMWPFWMSYLVLSFPFRLAGAFLHRLANPMPQVVVMRDSGMAGFVGSEPSNVPAETWIKEIASGETGFVEDVDECCEDCEHCPNQCQDYLDDMKEEATGFAPEPERNGFAPERNGFIS